MAHRVVEGLKFAQLAERPQGMPSRRPRGSRGFGLRFEGQFAKALSALYPSKVRHGQWFYYSDLHGPGYAQPDVLLLAYATPIIFECKLTECQAGRDQIRELYAPVIASAMRQTPLGIVVTRHLTKETNLALVCDSLAQALRAARTGVTPTLHWLGRGPL